MRLVMHTAFPTLFLLVLASVPSTAGTVALVAGEGLNEPFGIAFDAEGNTYVVEAGAHRVSVVTPKGERRVIAGTGEAGSGGDGGPALEARFNAPHHLLIRVDR
jgi:hypothetical protein